MTDLFASWSIPYVEKFQLIYWADQLRSMPSLALVLSLTAGILFLLYGRSAFRLIVILNAMTLAGWLGWTLGKQINHPMLFSVGLAVVFGLLAWPMFKFGVAILFGLIGALLLTQLASLFAFGQQYWPIFSAGGFIFFAILGWFLLMAAVTVFTAVEGAGLAVLSLVVLLERAHLPLEKLPGFSFARPGLIHLAILVLTILGVLYQSGLAGKKDEEAQKAETP